MSVYFNPAELKTYKSKFTAEVDTSGLQAVTGVKSSAKGQSVTFDLAGSGTLPCISIEEPTTRSAGRLLLDFKKVHVGKFSRKLITLRNDGVMPATCLFDINGGENEFLFPFKGSRFDICFLGTFLDCILSLF